MVHILPVTHITLKSLLRIQALGPPGYSRFVVKARSLLVVLRAIYAEMNVNIEQT